MRFVSLFSGIEACSTAWHPRGWTCAAVAEIEPFPCAVLAERFGASAPRHLPAGFARRDYRGLPEIARVPNLGDVAQVTDAEIAALGPLDVVVGGSPCQDLSVAGKRKGLAGARSGLFHQQLRIFHAARTLCGARFLVWENVPGAFSSNGGRDFAVVAGEMAGLELAVPRDGWGNEGMALGPHGLVEWCVLDAQWFGVAQRRRRVFALLDTGNWADRPPLLLEPESLRGDSAPRRESGQNAAGCARAGAALGVADVTGTLATGGGGHAVPGTCAQDAAAGFLIAMGSGQAGAEIVQDGGAPTLTCLHEAPIVAHTLRASDGGPGEDGTGRGTPLVPVAFDTTQITSAANRSNPKPGDPCHPLAAGAHPPAVAYDIHGVPATAGASATDVHTPLRARLPGQSEASTTTVVQQAMAVRRLTPRECERLQGFPDDHTRIAWRGKDPAECPDGPRYKALGNSMAVPVMAWIGARLEAAVAASAGDP